MMLLLRTHYFVDLVAGVIFAHYLLMVSEYLSYYVDVRLLRQRAEGRGRIFYKPCCNCGHPNAAADDLRERVPQGNLKAEWKTISVGEGATNCDPVNI